MWYAAERHPHHLGAGQALRQTVQDGTVSSAVFAVSRLWWRLPCLPGDRGAAGHVRRQGPTGGRGPGVRHAGSGPAAERRRVDVGTSAVPGADGCHGRAHPILAPVDRGVNSSQNARIVLSWRDALGTCPRR